MIKTEQPISMTEAKEYFEKKSDIEKFANNFTKLSVEKAKELREKITALDLMKVRDTHVAKIIDFLPKNSEELNKIFTDISLDEDETKQLLDTIKEFN